MDENEQKSNNGSYGEVLARFNALAQSFGGLSADSVFEAFSRAGLGMENQMQIQNSRVKAINPLPCDYSKEDLGGFLVNPYSSEQQIGEVVHGLKYTAYPLFKIIKTEADILSYHSYILPVGIDSEKAKTKDFKREYALAEEIRKAVEPERNAHIWAMKSGEYGKTFYTARYEIDKQHGKVNTFFLQQLPQNWCHIIGFNNISKYTISFDMMYFAQEGTDYRQFGDLFLPYIEDFKDIFKPKEGEKFVYASVTEKSTAIKIGETERKIYLENYTERKNASLAGNPRLFQQNGKWAYYVSLPIDRVWTAEIDDSDVGKISPYAGLLTTFSQQADYEAAQLSLIVQPLVKIFTGEMENIDDPSRADRDNFRPTVGMRDMFLAMWSILMRNNHTNSAFYAAPFKNIRAWDNAESANANDISSSFNAYSMGKAGLTAIIPVNENPHQGISEYSSKVESRFNSAIYSGFEMMVNHILRTMNFKHKFIFKMFGSIFTDELTRANALKQLANGDTTQHYILAALDGVSILDKISMSTVLEESGFLEHLKPPITSYTQSNKSGNGADKRGAPTKTETEIAETKIEEEISNE